MKTVSFILVILLPVSFFFLSCAPGSGDHFSESGPAGFLFGLWHGMIALFTLIVSFFSEAVRMYEINNTGVFYDLGYFIGILIVYGGSSHTVRTRKVVVKES